MAPHNLTFTLIGACLLWVGWFGFNAGSNLEANGLTAQALLNTITATSAAALSWSAAERIVRGHASLLGAASGAVAGLVAITPAAGLAGTIGAIFLGALAGVVCLWAVISLKPMLKYDDSLDVFGVHGVGGMVGALGTAIVASPALGGFGPGAEAYSASSQFFVQLTAVFVAVVWSGVVSFVALLSREGGDGAPAHRGSRARRARSQLPWRARLQQLTAKAEQLPDFARLRPGSFFVVEMASIWPKRPWLMQP